MREDILYVINQATNQYLSYAHEDEALAEQLQKHLIPLRRQTSGIVILDTPIRPGSEWSRELDHNINRADIIILLISADFLASDYVYSVEMKRALERHYAKEAYVIPVILRPVVWNATPFNRLQVLPSNGKPVTTWPNEDDAFTDVVQGIRQAIERISQERLAPPSVIETTPEKVIASLPRKAQAAARFGKTATLRRALEEYHAKHPNERLVIQDNDEFLYYDNIAQVTYIWQIWQTLCESVSSRKISQLLPLFKELLSSLCSSLSTSVNAPIKQDHSSLFFFTTLDTQHVFANLNMPRQIPVIFYTAPFFDISHKNELHQLLMDIIPSSRFAILLFFTSPKYLYESQRLLKHFQKAYAYDIIPMTCNEFLKITEAREPGKIFRQWILSQADLSVISPFTTSGPTPEGMFFGREQELRTIREHVRTASYALVGGRRIGKTSILKHLWRIGLPKIGIRAFYQDCSYIQTQADLVQAVSLDPAWFPESPSAPLSSFASVIEALPHNQPIAFLLDEADKLIEPDKSAGYPLLNTLRAFANAGRCQIVFGGEYALLSDMKNPRSPLYNFANELLVGHLDARAVRELIIQPMHDLEIELEEEDKIVERIWNFTAGHPNVIQRLCQRLVMRINGSQHLRLSIEDVERVIANTDFLRDDFLDTYWGQATLLERLCTLVMAKQQGICTLVDIHGALSNLAPGATLSDVNEALEGLVNLRNLLQRTSRGYVFAVKGFPRVIAQTYELDDLIALTSDKYRQARHNSNQ